jgi:5-methylcytosine-specific restriction endonuclease McrA
MADVGASFIAVDEGSEAMNRNKRFRLRMRAKAIARMGGRCVHCGFDDARALVFDHVKPVRRGLRGVRKSGHTGVDTHRAVLKGSKAYQLLCANCHAIKTRQDDANGAMSVNLWLTPSKRQRLLSGDTIETDVQLDMFDR